jgi:drug/metabolite transporter (DMT)-like permease
MCVLIGLPSAVRETEYSGQIVLCAILMGVFQLGLAYLCFTIGIRTAPPVSASLVSGIEPILNPVLVAIVLGESLSGLALLGGGIVFISIMIYNILTVRTENTKKELQKI